MLIVVSIPAVIAAIVWAVLHRRRSDRAERPRSVGARGACSALFSVLSLASIGIFILPVVAMLALAAKLTPSPALG